MNAENSYPGRFVVFNVLCRATRMNFRLAREVAANGAAFVEKRHKLVNVAKAVGETQYDRLQRVGWCSSIDQGYETYVTFRSDTDPHHVLTFLLIMGSHAVQILARTGIHVVEVTHTRFHRSLKTDHHFSAVGLPTLHHSVPFHSCGLIQVPGNAAQTPLRQRTKVGHFVSISNISSWPKSINGLFVTHHSSLIPFLLSIIFPFPSAHNVPCKTHQVSHRASHAVRSTFASFSS